jgi:hypothetical protein
MKQQILVNVLQDMDIILTMALVNFVKIQTASSVQVTIQNAILVITYFTLMQHIDAKIVQVLAPIVQVKVLVWTAF